MRTSSLLRVLWTSRLVNSRPAAAFILVLVCSVPASIDAAPAALQFINRQTFHLRSGERPEWDEFANQVPDGAGLMLRFASQSNAAPATLFIVQDNVKQDWGVQLNGRNIGALFLMEAPLVQALTIPAGALLDGENTLWIRALRDQNDDIILGAVALDSRAIATALNAAHLDIHVTDSVTGGPLPCRLTIVDKDGNLAALAAAATPKLAVRPGVVYTADGSARVGVLPGEYTICATRGFEYGIAKTRVLVAAERTEPVQLQIEREVDTPGWVSSDTHIHTGTFARHGDATVEERALTLAGEGIELPISTEHDMVVDFTPAAERAGVQGWFTPVIGEEVTTAKGHFNIFPVDQAAVLPDKKIDDWPALMRVFRETKGVQVVVLNHPRNVHNSFQPFAATNFNAVTGENLRGFQFAVDAVEIANSSALQSNWRVSIEDWLALLNYGYRFTAVGSSDGHDVSRYIVGQGRTYIAAADADPGRIDVGEACRNLRAGRAWVSLGLLANMTVNDQFGVGDIAKIMGSEVRITVDIQGPSWSRADRVELFANGIRIRDSKIDEPRVRAAGPSRPFRARQTWTIPKPTHDVHLVALASGPGIREPFWALARPYQPSSPTWDPRVLAVTNPIWIDADGDARFSAAREYAQRLVQEHPGDAKGLVQTLATYDEAVAAQAVSVCAARNWDIEALRSIVAVAPEHVRRGFERYAEAVRAAGNL